MSMTDTGLVYEKGGRRYPIHRSNLGRAGLVYIYDPYKELRAERASVADYLARTPSARRQLGDVPAAAFNVASEVANYIPGVGPLISSAINIASSIFGGGDPTALSALMNQVMQLRAQIAAANNQMGHADTFTIPAGFNAQNKDAARDPVDAVVESVLGVTEAGIQGDRRADYYKAISALQSILAQAQQGLHDQQLAQTIVTEVDTGPGAPAGQAAASQAAAGAAPIDATAADAATAAPGVPLWAYLVLGAGAAILAARVL